MLTTRRRPARSPEAGSHRFDETTPAITIEGLIKTYGATQALRGVDLHVEAGTVHALVGENGAGKSTALGVVAGRVAPTSGRVAIFGEDMRFGDPRASRRAGVAAIYQELTTIPALTGEANVFYADPVSRGGLLHPRETRRRYVELCERVGVSAAGHGVQARDLSVAEQQVLEILRAVVSGARIVLFDEPTASLAVSEREALFRLMDQLKADGVTMVLVSHNLDEVLDVSDRITVFRDGQLVVSDDRDAFTKSRLVTAMIGDEGERRVSAQLLDETATTSGPSPRRAPRRVRSDESAPLLAVEGLSVPGTLTGISCEVRAGEVLGIGGLVGAGRTSLLRALAGLTPTAQGRLWIDGREVPWPKTVRQALRLGIALVPEDRKSQGLVLPMRVADNIALSDFDRLSRVGVLTSRAVRDASAQVAPAFGLSLDRLRDRASTLSGGNQQKLLLARWKHVVPRVLLADEPTRGIDVGAKAEILRSLESMADDDGVGIVVVSSELEEIVAISDRVLVLAEGRSAGHLDRAAGELSTDDILARAFGVQG